MSTSPDCWVPLKTLRETADISSLCTNQNGEPQLAKDSDYANAVLSAWREDAKAFRSDGCDSIGHSCIYKRKDGVEFNGYIVAPSTLVEQDLEESRPVVLLFHTGAGPQDIFLRWKADCLVQKLECIVMIVDIISDRDGFAWTNREQYETARKDIFSVFERNGSIGRWNLRDTLDSALDYLHGLQYADTSRVAGMGYCMGGHPIFELGMMRKENVKALISYHGVFDGASQHKSQSESTPAVSPTKILICNGKKDPFVPTQDLESAVDLLRKAGNDVDVKLFDCFHGFTNPAQDYNPSDAFAFNEEAASSSWDATIHLLRKELFNR